MTTPSPEKVSICEIGAEPERYVGRLVNVEAYYVTDYQHYSWLAVEACPEINLWIEDLPDDGGTFWILNAVLADRVFPRMYIVGRFVGRVSRGEAGELRISVAAFDGLFPSDVDPMAWYE